MVLGFDSVKLLSQDKLSSYLRIYVLSSIRRDNLDRIRLWKVTAPFWTESGLKLIGFSA